MTTKYKVILVILALVLSFASGRWLAPTKTVTVTHTVEVEKQVDKSDTRVKEHKTTVVVKQPNGASTTTVTEDKSTGTDTVDTTQTASITDTSKTVTRSKPSISFSILGAENIHSISASPAIGGMVSKQILGPITATAFGLSNGVVGLGIGLTF